MLMSVSEYGNPWITCPPNVIFVLLPNQKEADISTVLRKPTSNMKDIRLTPEKYKQLLFPAGTTYITYTAFNGANKTESCNVKVIVQGKLFL